MPGHRHNDSVIAELLGQLDLTFALEISLVGTTQSKILTGDAILFQEIIGENSTIIEQNIVCVLHVIRLLIGLTVQINNMLDNLQGITRQANTTFHIVLATISRTIANTTKLLLISYYILTAQVVILLKATSLFCFWQRVNRKCQGEILLINLTAIAIAHAIILCLEWHILTNRITSGIVEHHDIIEFHLTQSRHTTVFPMRPLNV